MSEYKKYESVKEFICDLIDNEGVTFGDTYGRHWVYKDYEFHFCNIGYRWKHGLDCLHLYGTGIKRDAR